MGSTINSTLIAAICTPQNADDALHVEGLEAHVEDQWRAGMTGILVAGTMGRMQLLSDETYRRLIRATVRISRRRGEVMVGVGDTSFARTRDRIRAVEEYDIDAVVVLTPYFVRYTDDELVDYFRALADCSRRPVYLYNLPSLTGTPLSLDVVLRLSRHPNIHGIKCSCSVEWVRQLMDKVDSRFRVIVANPFLVDMLAKCGVREQLDGVYSVVPDWTVNIIRAAEAGRWDEAAAWQARLTAFRSLVPVRYPVHPAFTVVLNERGIPGKFFSAPMRPLSEERRAALLAEPIVRELLGRT